MKYSARFIIYMSAINYLEGEILDQFNEKLKSNPVTTINQLMKVFNEFIDLELLKDKPYIWQDIWIYNYLTYRGLRNRIELIKQYEKSIVIPTLENNEELNQNLKNWGTYYLMAK